MSPLRHPFVVLLLALALGVGAVQLTKGDDSLNAQVASFPDVDPWTLEGKATIYLREAGILSGFDDGLFHGDFPFTRAQTAKMFLIAAQKPLYNVRNAGIFSDVYDNQWYARYVMSAAIHEMINGYPDGTFRPNNTVNTAEFIKLISSTFGAPTYMPHSYLDVGSIDWFNPYAGIAKYYELFPDRRFDLLEPGRPLTRKEAAIALYQYLVKKNEPFMPSSSSSAEPFFEQPSSAPLELPTSSVSSPEFSASSSEATLSSAASSSPQAIAPSSSSESSSAAFVLPSSSSSSSMSLQSQVCYYPPAPPKGCYYVCEQNVSCLKAEQCQLRCVSSASSAGL